MGWDNPPVPWRELERRLSWGTSARRETGRERAAGPRPRPVTRLPAGPAGEGLAGEGLAGEGPVGGGPPGPAWAELHCHSSYSFLDGASAPAELVAEAARLGLAALAITDHDGMYGVPQFAQAAAKLTERTGITLGTVFGAELSVGSASPGGRPPWNPPVAQGPVPSSRGLGRAGDRPGV